MSYRVLARAYRSLTFEDVVGQEPIATTLRNALRSGRVHHAFLFTGTRGVGKTSMARILAKALNCLSSDGPTRTPCCKCDLCLAAAEGQDVDVVEIDAASNTGVDNIRELRGNTTLRPARARFKVYIIDEVHMLSTGAFNALLKTLEEPPPHVKFILATTESQKVPATIQSRCQRFDFRAIDVSSLAKHIAKIAELEKVSVDEDVCRRVARLANGSMRDALSLLDQLISYGGETLTRAVVDEVVPPPHDELSLTVIEHVSTSDAAGALAALDQALQTGRTVDRFCDHLIEHVRTLMLLRVCGPETDLVDVAAAIRPTLLAQADRFDGPTFVYMIAHLEELRRNVKFSGAARALADAAVVRLAMARQFSDIGEILARLEQGEGVAPTAETPPAASKKKERPDNAIVNTAAVSRVPAGEASRTPPQGVPRVPASKWESAVRDPLVQKVKAAVEGTVVDVRPYQRKEAGESAAPSMPRESATDSSSDADAAPESFVLREE